MFFWAPASSDSRKPAPVAVRDMEKNNGRPKTLKSDDSNGKAHASTRTMEQQIAKFQNVLLPQYTALRHKLEQQLQSYEPLAVLEQDDALRDRNEFISVTSKVIRRDPRLFKSRYEDIFWRLVYPLVRTASDKSEVLGSPVTRKNIEDLVNCSRTAFQNFIETFLVRFGFCVESLDELPALCEACAEQQQKFKAAHVEWIRTFVSHCLCSIGDLYRYSKSYDQKGLVLATKYYELAALVRPSDGRAVSCLGIVQKEAGEVFPAAFYSLISACKKSPYPHFLKNIEAMKGPVDELCSAFWIETGHPHAGEDPRETIKIFSVHILNLTTRLLLNDEPDAEKLRHYFAVALEYLGATLERPVAHTDHNWKNLHYRAAEFLYPNLLWKISLMTLLIYHLKKNEVSGVRRGSSLNSLCAFVVTMMGKVTRCVVDSMRYWLQYTSFNLVPEPDPEFVVDELKAIRKSQQSSSTKTTGNKLVGNVQSLDNDGDEPVTFEAGDAGTQRNAETSESVLVNNENELSMEDFWMSSENQATSPDDERPRDSPTPHSRFLGSSYLQAFLGFMDTQMHLPLVQLFFQWIRCDEEMWGFCVANFPDIICDVVDIINTVCKPKFVGMYVVGA
ncbi:hypothetical protein RvY_00895-2 [Ramazzottius varieornatus]|uniref:Uncharacterized protein n=1 Tax=Ramazzottius varieornatus TaxID=947166 RepID=A0A1D1ULK2_RAMVA|nr:hypothetical protein RvY_00895-2 [Ramazzottius varieornatus]